MSASWVVLKFGGASVATAAGWDTVARLVHRRLKQGVRPIVVHSAVAGVTDQLEALIELARRNEHAGLERELGDHHRELAREMNIEDPDGCLRPELENLAQLLRGIALTGEAGYRARVKVLALGERLAGRFGAAALELKGISISPVNPAKLLRAEARDWASERDSMLHAVCAHDPDPEAAALLESLPGVPLTQGFIARNAEGEEVLLGRGGSDVSAAALAASIGALRLEMWTDVPGIFSADPREISGARLLRRLSYAEAQEIATSGGGVLHPLSIAPLRESRIGMTVRSTLHPELPGTAVGPAEESDSAQVKAVMLHGGVPLVSLETLGMWRRVGFLKEVFTCFGDLGLSVDLVSTSESNVTVTLDTDPEVLTPALMDRLRSQLERIGQVTITTNTSVVTLVGRRIRAVLHEVGPALEAFREQPIHLLSQAASDLNISFVVEPAQARRLAQRLHGRLIVPDDGDELFGPAWEELTQATPVAPAGADAPWWAERRGELLKLAEERGATYAYSLERVAAQAQRLNGLESIDRVYYAIKANSNPGVLRRVRDSGLEFECVSPGEVRLLRELFPDHDPGRILFTPNFAARSEYAEALEAGVQLTVDNLGVLRDWPQLFAGRDLFLRLDPGVGRGLHRHVRTAGVHSKFGVPLFEVQRAARAAADAGARVIGLHAHMGSGVMDPGAWAPIAETLLECLEHFPDARVVNLGGGLGVPQHGGEQGLDLAELDANLARCREGAPRELEFWLEPGRYVVAEAGVLLARVTQVKGKSGARYVGVETGMNSLIRPALYGSYHEVHNLTRLDEPATRLVNVVGPICESGDVLARDRMLPECREGDVLLFANAGAYGRVMASNYNLREPAAEEVIA
ncbi:MAG: bifunctional aspartate kinase/diaminopimelate decarboxylase [Gammaproteobacteria bacterium]|nr:bifunctional aspartate kinase/diaminopimelate decarboxylase [Gammaproteobacteria bacterium]MYF67256.1 bifunctional aspartate kinase/diaminopimelate decarboxylase [Gammaproteobacteria bacterium]MYK36689.1 bifunctional aspartate kinase/diaminopimelate decarboxylase [Gammaproteobacteria bacterium]